MEIDRNAILASFRVESQEGMDSMEQALLALESRPGDTELVQVIFRAVHTLKGSAFALDLNELGTYAHGLEDVLDRVLKGTAPVTGKLCTQLLRVADVLRRAVNAATEGKDQILEPEARLLQQMRFTAGLEEQPAHPAAAQENRGETASVFAAAETRRTLRVDVDKLDRMLNLTGELAIAQGRLERLLTELGEPARLAMETQSEIKHLFISLQEQVMKVRMVPMQPLFQQFYRVVRDTARGHGKLARLVIEGGEVEMDNTIVERLKDPLMHMIRNAIDHGLETPKARRRKNKPPQGTITLRAAHESGTIVIQVLDDGAGFDRERILAHAAARGMQLEAKKMSDQEVFSLVFHAGFSTATEVTELSGRGVGMEVVKRNIEQLRGTVRVDSAAGQGSTITIRLPLTLAIINGFSVRVGEDTFVLPLESVVECLEMPQDFSTGPSGGVMNLRGQPLPCMRLRDLFEISGQAPEHENVVVVEHSGGMAGLAADALVGEHQAVIKPMGRLFDRVKGISGSTILGNGQVALILDVPGLCQEMIDRQRALDLNGSSGEATA